MTSGMKELKERYNTPDRVLERAIQEHEDLLAASKSALPFLRDYVCTGVNVGQSADRIALYRLEVAVEKAEGK